MALAVIAFANIIGSGWSKFNIDDGNLYSIKFQKLAASEDENLLNPPDLLPTTVTMTTAHNEKYVCELPSDESEKKNDDDKYDVSFFSVLWLTCQFLISFLNRVHLCSKFLKRSSYNPSVLTDLSTTGHMSCATDGKFLCLPYICSGDISNLIRF